MSEENFISEIEDIEINRKELNSRFAELSTAQEQTNEALDEVQNLERHFSVIEDRLEIMDFPERRELVGSLITKATVQHDGAVNLECIMPRIAQVAPTPLLSHSLSAKSRP